ncbi:MAG: anthranilate synthase component I [Gemmatimonadetes bacterium]|nr:anthranilate synthase component I [Gemmatimonadota bacterium]
MRVTHIHLEAIEYQTEGGVSVKRYAQHLSPDEAIEPVVDGLDSHPGALFASGYEYPGRYTRWDMGFVDPPIRIESRKNSFHVLALNARGKVLLPAIHGQIEGLRVTDTLSRQEDRISGEVLLPDAYFPEEQRSRQPSIFSILRGIIGLFSCPDEHHLGLYGAFGYDLAFQFEPMDYRLRRPADQRDLVLYLPDRLVTIDHNREVAIRYDYEFETGGESTQDLPREGAVQPYRGGRAATGREFEKGAYGDVVRKAHEYFRRGDLFEVVPSQTFYESCPDPPSEIFRRLRERNPAPYATLVNLGQREYLVGASPEMFVRGEGIRIETCPIAGTVSRGNDALSDADQILKLLSSEKEDSELTMCTDVDRNDKSRVCVPGSVRVIGRRQIEMYSRVIHTVDHVEGILRPEYDALDAFLSHAWAVTVTGAPKIWAMRFIENHERSCRAWYGGAIGFLGFDGNMNTGLTLRTIRIKDGIAEVRAGSTLLMDSSPEDEERETELKAMAFIDAIRRPRGSGGGTQHPGSAEDSGVGKRVFLVDYEDSFVHTLANYLRQTGADVLTVRTGFSRSRLTDLMDAYDPDLVFLSPGPGQPSDFDVALAIDAALERSLPVFGVCLGLQGIVEYFGGTLGELPYPVHGKESRVIVRGGRAGALFEGFPPSFTVGRYHSLYAERERLPLDLSVTAESDDGIVMAVEHRTLPVAAVQFHPESIMTLKDRIGLRLIGNLFRKLVPVADKVDAGREGNP